MLERLNTTLMLSPKDVAPSDERMRVAGAFNPGVAQYQDEVVLVVRVVEEVVEQRDTQVSSPRIQRDGEMVIDWINTDELDLHDPRVYHYLDSGMLRLRFISHFRIYFSKDGRTIDRPGPVIRPEGVYEMYGIEDPRVTKIGETYYITYVAVSNRGVCTSLITTKDFQTFQRHGVMFPPDNKDVVLFPEKINGQYAAMHRPMPYMKFTLPQIWLAYGPDPQHWGQHHCLLEADLKTSDRIGGGTPPIRTERGWLTVYHGNDKLPMDDSGKLQVRYTGGALLLDPDQPEKLLARTPQPIIEPQEPYETHGFVNNVIFPTAIIERDKHFFVYNGAADENISVIEYDKNAFLNTLVDA